MTPGDDPSRDQWRDEWSTRWSKRRRDYDEDAFVEAVSGALYVPTAAPEIRMIAEIMASMSIPNVLEPVPVPAAEREHRRSRRGARLVGVAAAVALALGGLTAGAYAGVLPNSVQDVAHHVIKAPKSNHGKGHGPGHSTPVGPDVTGPAGVGLCNAYANASKNGNAAEKSVAFANLAQAAGGADKIEAFCAAVERNSSASNANTTHPAPAHSTSKPAGTPGRSGTPAGGPDTTKTNPNSGKGNNNGNVRTSPAPTPPAPAEPTSTHTPPKKGVTP